MYGNLYYPQTPIQLIRVNGIEGARAYQMPANSTVALFDTNNDIMYIRTTDGAGFPQIRTFSFTEQLSPKVDNNITRTEIDEIKAEIDAIKEALTNGKQSVRRKPETAE